MPGKKKPTLLICLSLAGLVLISITFAAWVRANRASLQDVKLGLPTWRIRIARIFSYDKNGHFSEQTQYLSKRADSENGNYCIQCRKGKVSAIFIKYTPPISREQSLRAMKRLIGNEQVCEKDESELANTASTQKALSTKKSEPFYCPPSEYLYFTHGKAAELQYVGPDDHRVTDLMVWG